MIDTVDGAVVDDIADGTLPVLVARWRPAGPGDAGRRRRLRRALRVRSPWWPRAPRWSRRRCGRGAPPWCSAPLRRQPARPPAAATVELVDRQVDARYALPGRPHRVDRGGGVTRGRSPRPQHHHRRRAWSCPAPGAPGTAQPLPGHLQALGFAGEGILVAVSTTGETLQLVRISVVGGDTTAVALGAGTADLQSVRVALDGRRLVCLAVDAHGVRQAYVANADGSGELAMTRFLAGGFEAQAVGFSD